jgi:hypothetical protein
MRKIFTAAAVAVLAALSVAVAPTAASAAPATGQLTSGIRDGVLRPACLDVPGGDDDAGTSVRLFVPCNNSEAQRFTADPNPAAVRDIRVLGKCLDVQGGATHSGARVQIWHCNGTGAQQWQFVPVPAFPFPGFSLLRNPQSGRCLYSEANFSAIFDCVNPSGAMVFRLDAQLF